MKKISSFDVFDTLLTRSVGVPRDLFLLLGDSWLQAGLSQSNARELALHRIQSEQAAAQRAQGGQPTLLEIYQTLAAPLQWTPQDAARAMQMELDLEAKNLTPVPGAIRLVNAAREEGRQIAFITDTYLPRDFIQSQLQLWNYFQAGDLLFVSNEARLGKAAGTLFDFAREKLGQPRDWRHFGDDAYSDVTQAQSRGINACHLPEGRLTRYEVHLRGGLDENLSTLWQSKLAGTCRLGRLETRARIQDPAQIIPVAAGVAAPLLVAFVIWCLREAERKNVRRLYFLARDGQILLKIAQALKKNRWPQIDCRYLAASRQAWHPAAITEFNATDLEKVRSAGGHMTLRNVMSLTALDPRICSARLEQFGFPESELDLPMTLARRAEWNLLLASGKLNDLIEQGARAKRLLLLEYLTQENFFDFKEVGIVDIGWYGRLQDSLERILSHFATNPPQVRGFYFGLKAPPAENRQGFWNEHMPRREVTPLEMAFLERFTAADHGSIIGFHRAANNTVEPLLAAPENTHAIHWGLPTMQSAIEAVAQKIAALPEFNDIDPGVLLNQSVQGLDDLIQHPTLEEAHCWGSFPMASQQIESTYETLIPAWTWPKALQAIRDHNARPHIWWKQAARLLPSPFPIWLYLRGLDRPIQTARATFRQCRHRPRPR